MNCSFFNRVFLFNIDFVSISKIGTSILCIIFLTNIGGLEVEKSEIGFSQKYRCLVPFGRTLSGLSRETQLGRPVDIHQASLVLVLERFLEQSFSPSQATTNTCQLNLNYNLIKWYLDMKLDKTLDLTNFTFDIQWQNYLLHTTQWSNFSSYQV